MMTGKSCLQLSTCFIKQAIIMVSNLCFNLFTLMLYFSSQSFTSEVGEGGGGLKVISPLDGGGQEVILALIQGGCNFILRPTLLILEPPLQIIIAQSLMSLVKDL